MAKGSLKSKVCGLLIMLIVSFGQGVAAQTIYKYVDADGGISYSDQLPENTVLIETLEIETPDPLIQSAAMAASSALIEQMAKTADRLKEDRQDRDAARLAAEKVRLEARPPPVVVYRETSGYPYYPYYPLVRKRHHHHRPFPDIHRQQDIGHRDVGFQGNGPLVPRSKLLTPR